MSWSRSFDAWLEEAGQVPQIEVVPDHACQEFSPEPGVIIVAGTENSGESHISPEEAAARVRDLLG